MKNYIMGLAVVLSMANVSSAQMVEFDEDMLKMGTVTPGKDCISVGVSLIVTASQGGRVTTYSTTASGFASGIYVGAVEGQLNTSNNKSAPKSGVYRLTFSHPVNSVELTIDAISNRFKPAETLSDFRTNNGSAQVKFQPVGNTVSFNSAKQIITANHGNGDGVITHSSQGKFDFFEFRHEQHPQNIGFTIPNVKVMPSQIACP